MASVSLHSIVTLCEEILRPDKFNDYPGAVNGLQAENEGTVRKLAAAVDASLGTVRMATREGADFLLVHHGLFWAPSYPWTGPRYELLRSLLKNNLAVYSSHLPLDAHPKFGNNARLCAALGWRTLKPFFSMKDGPTIGFQVVAEIGRAELAQRLRKVLGGTVTVLPGGPKTCRRIGVVSGGAGSDLAMAAAAGVDTFITGEGPHWTFVQAEQLGMNVLYGGHYATETFGVQALAEHLSKKFKLPWVFLDRPSGL